MSHDFLIALVNGFNTVCPGQTIQEDGTQQNSLKVGTHLMTQLAKLRDQYEIIGDVRGKGLHIGVEMVKDKVAGVCVFFLFVFRSSHAGATCRTVCRLPGGHGSAVPQLTISRSGGDHLYLREG